MTLYSVVQSALGVSDQPAPTLVLGHGAGAGREHPWMRRVASGLSDRGVAVATFDFPYMAEGRKRPDPGPVLEQAFADIWTDLVRTASSGVKVFAGGKSMGGRIASQAAARGLLMPKPAGLVFFGYPLHPPGKPAQRRDRHLPAIDVPMLFLHGTRDAFGSPEEMRELVAGLPLATLEIIEGGDHSLIAAKRDDPGQISLARAMDAAAKWMRT
jgi:predicted alpha/beta-hydrolase family hydrolase